MNLKILLTSALVILVDQITKVLVKEFLTLREPVRIIGDFLRFTYVENPGIAFGVRIGARSIFTLLSVAIVVVIFIYLFRAKRDRASVRFTLALVLGGAVGNLIDRIAYGRVVDFIDIGVKNLRWPVFNVADMAVTIGMIILLTLILFEKEQKKT